MCTHLYTVEQVELAVADGLGGGEEDAQDAAQLLHVVQLEHLINRFLQGDFFYFDVGVLGLTSLLVKLSIA